MKTSNKTTGLLAVLLLASPLAMAEPQYPAADFEPVIISRDADLISKHSQAAKDRESAEQAKLAKRSQSAAAAPVVSQASEAAVNVGSPKSDVSSNNQKESSSMENFPIALVVFALAGFVFWSTKRPGAKAQEIRYDSVAVSSGSVGGDTGVAKYLKGLEASARKAAGTGVTRYLKNLEASAAPKAAETGVAKYIKTADLSTKKTPQTGVERYLNGKGR